MQTKTSNAAAAANGRGDGATPIAAADRGSSTAVTRELHSFVADLEDLITATTSLSGADLARAKERLAARVDSARQAVGHAGTAIAQGARRSAVATDQYVHESPWQAVGIGAAAGALAGLLLGRRLARR